MIKPFIHGIIDGLNQVKGKPLKYNEKYNIKPLEVHEPTETELYNIEQLQSELLMLETIVKRDNNRALILERELTRATAKQRETIYNKLNTLDKQTFKHNQRINVLKDKLNELN